MKGLVDAWGFWGFHAAWQAAAVAVVVLAVVWLGRRWPAPIRYGLLLVALAKFALPPIVSLPMSPFSCCGPDVAHVESETVAPVAFGPQTIPVELPPVAFEVPEPEEFGPEFAATAPGLPEMLPTHSMSPTPVADDPWNWKLVLLSIHLLGMALVTGWLAVQWLRLRQLQRSACETSDERIRRRFAFLSKQLGMRRSVRLLIGSNDTVPCSFGLLRPVVIVPETLVSELSEDLDRVLAHELAHHRRGDLWVNAVQLGLFVVWWFNPLYWLLHRSLRTVREDCCDDLLLATGIASPGDYCDTILRVASNQKRTGPLAIASSMADYPHPLEKRFRRIMDGSLRRSVRLGWLGLVAVTALAIVLLPGARGSGESKEPPAATTAPDSTVVEVDASNAQPSKAPRGSSTTLSGRVMTASCEPIEGATVTLPEWGDKPPLAESQTDANGRFLLKLQEDASLPHRRSHPLLITAEDFATSYVHERHLSVFPGTNKDLGVIRLYRGQVFRGRVVDDTGNPVAGAKVTCTTIRHELGHTVADVGPPHETVTDSDGLYKTHRMPLGERWVIVLAEGFQLNFLDGGAFEAAGDGELPPLKLQPDTPIYGEVCDEEGNPIVGAEIRGNAERQVRSDRDGRFVLRGFGEIAQFQLQVLADGYAFVNWSVKSTPDGIAYYEVGSIPHGQDLDAKAYQKAKKAVTVRVPKLVVRMQRESHISGRAVDSDTGEPVTLSRIVLCTFTRKADGAVVMDGCRSSRFEQPKPGTFRLGYTYPTEYHLTLSADGYEDAEAFTPPVMSLEKIEGLLVKMKRKDEAKPTLPAFKQRIHGIVTHNGELLDRARIALWRVAKTSNAENAWILRGRTTTGDGVVMRSQPLQNGRFDLEVPYQGDNWYLLVETPRRVCALAGPWAIAKGETKALEIETRDPGTIRGRVTNLSADSPDDLWAVAFSKYGIQYETPITQEGTFAFENVYPGEYGLKVGCDAVRDSEVPRDRGHGMSEEERYKMGSAPSQPWKRAVKVNVESGKTKEGIELQFDP